MKLMLKKHTIFTVGGDIDRSLPASILKAKGFSNLVDIAGGFAAVKKTRLPIVNGRCKA